MTKTGTSIAICISTQRPTKELGISYLPVLFLVASSAPVHLFALRMLCLARPLPLWLVRVTAIVMAATATQEVVKVGRWGGGGPRVVQQ